MIFINFKAIELEDKPIFDKVFSEEKYEGAECTFTNLYMWRETYNITWTMEDDFVCIKTTFDGLTYVLPPFPRYREGFFDVLDKLIEYFKDHNLPFVMGGLTKDLIDYIEKNRPDTFNFEENEDLHDYVYDAQKLITLSGRKYHKKKNHVNAFKKEHGDYEYLDMTEELTKPCIEAAIEWCEKKECPPERKESIICERDALIEALKEFTYLGFKGGVIKIDGKVEAFTFGEPLNEEMVVIHVEKANPDIRGLYAVINQDFCKNNWQDMKYINREEDLGLEGLRKAKKSYRPVKMIEKYTIKLKEEV